MTTKLVELVLLCLMSGTAMAQEPKVTSLMSKDLTENPGRDPPRPLSRRPGSLRKRTPDGT
jgi:hypothetical protein